MVSITTGDFNMYIARLGMGRNTLEESGGLRVDDETLGFLVDVERVKDDVFQGEFKTFFSVLVTVMSNAHHDHDDIFEAVETWIKLSLKEHDAKQAMN